MPTPEELQAENERLTQANAAPAEKASADIERLKQANTALRRTNAEMRDLRRGPAPQTEHALSVENAGLKAELARVKGEVAAEHGPEQGTEICYQGPGEPYCRPAKILS